MIIRSIRLRNIRSYVDETINFPKGSVLLSGDIGSGKTSILLALEFAIFGVMKGVLSGSALLRHGASHGFVELRFSLGEDELVIKRSLRRTSNGIIQEPGVLIVNNTVFEGTPQELKARVLELIGYPESLLTKSKSLIFRYTVFTPQEEMKRILYEKKEERLDILRKLFNIDKYKRVKENALNYVRELKNKISVLEGKLEVLPDKTKELEEYSQQAGMLRKEVEEKEDSLLRLREEFSEVKKRFELLEKELEKLRGVEKDFEVKKAELESFMRRLEERKVELEKVNSVLGELVKGLEGFDITKADEVKQLLKAKKQELRRIDEKLSEINSRKAEFKTRKEASELIIKKIADMDVCPTCLQKISVEHAREVNTKQQVIIKKCEVNLARLDEWEKRLCERRRRVEEEIDNYIQGEKELEAKKVKLEALEEKKEHKKILETNISELEDKITRSKQAVEELKHELEKGEDKRKEFKKAKEVLEERREEKERLEKLVVEKKTRLATLTQIIDKLKQELDKLKQDEKKLLRLSEVRNWMQTHFINLIDVIEKHILARIYNEFNAFFQEWFNTLLEDETLSVRLDEYFSPVIEQNGYETWLENLSGGEKTSVALAYRLALNKVINDFLSTIRTRDLIILDEPTDGFSSEQLDRVREVLNQLNVEQAIIVSHEAKMESFVDSIIRVRKQGHESRVIAG